MKTFVVVHPGSAQTYGVEMYHEGMRRVSIVKRESTMPQKYFEEHCLSHVSEEAANYLVEVLNGENDNPNDRIYFLQTRAIPRTGWQKLGAGE